jgi:DNA-binding HxlR family transcriptional regulator
MNHVITYSLILNILSKHKFGISFNQLAKKLKGRVSRLSLKDCLEELKKRGLITIRGDPTHKQRKIYRVEKSVLIISEMLETISFETKLSPSNITAFLSKLIRHYIELKDEIRKDDLLKSYAKQMVLSKVSNLLDVLLLTSQEAGL